MTAASTLLIADDDPVALALLAEVLSREGYRVRAAASGEECLRVAEAEPVDLAIVDLRMPGLDGLQVMRGLATIQPGVPVLVLTAFVTIDTAIQAIRAGAYDYLSKPFRMEEMKVVVRRALEARRLASENRQYRRELEDRYGVQNLQGQSPQMVEVYKLVARVSALETTVLIQGETGTGKELVARAIHYASPRAGRPFVVVDCTALPEGLFESELFGHERGAFTGALSTRRGLLETSDGGTCLLDEIGDLAPTLQAKLLRLLQERAIRRVGGNEVLPVNVRIIAATNRDLGKRVAEGAFREDLYYRLNVVTIVLPPLRERSQDIPLLAQHFLEKYARAAGKPTRGFAPETLAVLSGYHWPGNVRELEHAVERAVALSSSEVLVPGDLPELLRRGPDGDLRLPTSRMTLEEVKQWYVAKVLEEAGGNKVRAAELLGIDRGTLYRILRRHASEGDTEG
ncbi:MAG: sigma-54-dependent Fis family transcriptional regulator [Candidatus Rokubacteria bacterium]|nr:sigma-54-dependent Fis family transcriptional regulator [Candidatus Rokubacteria bacterium]MBI2526548.1 sigma-54-dependent Fis family transcriptional regulator [Candidatus Rokubacteria bacterium]